jgi:hypothetical protein
LDGGFHTNLTTEALTPLTPDRVFITGRQQPGSRRTQRRLQRYRTGAEGRISHLKRGYGLDAAVSLLQSYSAPSRLDLALSERCSRAEARRSDRVEEILKSVS